MENAAALMQTPAYAIFSAIRTMVTASLGPALCFVLMCEPGSRGRYTANTVLRTMMARPPCWSPWTWPSTPPAATG